MSNYDHYKHKDLPENVKGIKRNQNSESYYGGGNDNGGSGGGNGSGSNGGSGGSKGPSIAKLINRRILVAMSSMVSLPDEHIQTYNSMWFGLLEYVEDCSRKEGLDVSSLELLETLMNSGVYLNETEIISRPDIANRLGELEKIVRKYVD